MQGFIWLSHPAVASVVATTEMLLRFFDFSTHYVKIGRHTPHGSQLFSLFSPVNLVRRRVRATVDLGLGIWSHVKCHI